MDSASSILTVKETWKFLAIFAALGKRQQVLDA